MNRRDFLKRAGAVGVGLGLGSYIGGSARAAGVPRSIGPNDKITVAVIGTNGRGLAHIQCLTKLPGVETSHERKLDRALKRLSDLRSS